MRRSLQLATFYGQRRYFKNTSERRGKAWEYIAPKQNRGDIQLNRVARPIGAVERVVAVGAQAASAGRAGASVQLDMVGDGCGRDAASFQACGILLEASRECR